ncbi:MAG: dipeptidase [Phycisphaerales bacterium]|nr:dipeptidase [Phycisphaerae bacterium]NNF45085.1 dipeptidase [Phycisphaerales bacterium]NNM26112.1 dipeptidase [Phycisphaerales bacterium]
MTDLLTPVTERIDAEFDASVERLKELLRIPSISTDPAYRDRTKEAAEWCAGVLTDIGLDASVRSTTGHPMVVAHDPGPGPDAPHLLYYAHYDVQPPDPLELWEHDPFDPIIADSPHGGRIVARGACDDKGQMMTFLEAFRHWRAVHGTLPVRVTVLLEGEEESGSPSLEPFLEAHRSELAADVAVVTDTGMWNIDTPAITYMLRGLVYTDVTLHGPTHDLHSGMYGGAVVNPLNALARILGGLHDDAGVVQIPGFYDDVRELSADERERWRNLGFDEAAFLASAGLEVGMGEQGRSTLERTWCRPSCDVNGMWGGYTGEGAKTVIASEAHAKISCRLVADQDPQAISAGLVRFLEDRTPPGCRWTFEPHGCNSAIRVPTDSPFLEAARDGLRRTFGTNAELIGCGGSIPVVGSFQSLLGFDSLLVGFGLDDDRVHSPNEKFELRCYQMGIRAQAAMLESFASVKSPVGS